MRSPSAISIAVLFALAVLGPVACFPVTTGAPCSTDDNCPTGQRCASGLCTKGGGSGGGTGGNAGGGSGGNAGGGSGGGTGGGGGSGGGTMADGGNLLTPLREITSASGRMKGSTLTVDVEVGHPTVRTTMTGGTLSVTGSAAVQR